MDEVRANEGARPLRLLLVAVGLFDLDEEDLGLACCVHLLLLVGVLPFLRRRRPGYLFSLRAKRLVGKDLHKISTRFFNEIVFFFTRWPQSACVHQGKHLKTRLVVMHSTPQSPQNDI